MKAGKMSLAQSGLRELEEHANGIKTVLKSASIFSLSGVFQSLSLSLAAFHGSQRWEPRKVSSTKSLA